MFNKNRKLIIIITLFILLVGGSFAINNWLRNEKYQQQVKDININEVDLSTIKNGEYIGEYAVEYISVKVKVTIKDNKFKNIEYIYHNNERGQKANIITNNIVKQDKIKVDTISGATNSSKVIQKAVELALSK